MTDWNKAPEWAKYCALNSNGWYYWYENKPTITPTGWMCEGKYQLAHRPNWQASLEERE